MLEVKLISVNTPDMHTFPQGLGKLFTAKEHASVCNSRHVHTVL